MRTEWENPLSRPSVFWVCEGLIFTDLDMIRWFLFVSVLIDLFLSYHSLEFRKLLRWFKRLRVQTSSCFYWFMVISVSNRIIFWITWIIYFRPFCYLWITPGQLNIWFQRGYLRVGIYVEINSLFFFEYSGRVLCCGKTFKWLQTRAMTRAMIFTPWWLRTKKPRFFLFYKPHKMCTHKSADQVELFHKKFFSHWWRCFVIKWEEWTNEIGTSTSFFFVLWFWSCFW